VRESIFIDERTMTESSKIKSGVRRHFCHERDRELNCVASIGKLNLIRITDSMFDKYLSGKIDEPRFYCVHLKG